METLAKLLTAVAVPLSIFNMLGGIVSVIWLGILGEWGLIGYGVLAIMFSGMLLGFAMLPGMLLAAPAVAMMEKNIKIGGYFFGLLSTIYTLAVLSAWCILVLLYYTDHATSNSIIPVLIWSYSVATAPIMWLAQKDLQSGNDHAMISTFFIEVAYILSILGILFVGVSLIEVMVLFAVVMTAGIIMQFSLAFLIEKEQQYY